MPVKPSRRRARKSQDAILTGIYTPSGQQAPEKYRNIKTRGYASRKEANRAAELRMLEKAGIITDLREQVRFELIPKQDGERAVVYVADFVYFDNDSKCSVVEDCKGFRTRDYIIKRKLFQHKYGYRITEV